MIYSKTDLIKGLAFNEFYVDPFPVSNIQPASIDLHLDLTKVLTIPYNPFDEMHDLTDNARSLYKELPGWDLLESHNFLLVSTLETITIGNSVVGIINGKSSLARLGIQVHATAGYLDPGFKGQITLELYNFSQQCYRLTHGIPICQLIIQRLQTALNEEDLYKGKYQNQVGVTGSKYHENF